MLCLIRCFYFYFYGRTFVFGTNHITQILDIPYQDALSESELSIWIRFHPSRARHVILILSLTLRTNLMTAYGEMVVIISNVTGTCPALH